MVRESLSPGEALDANGMAMAVDRTMPSLASQKQQLEMLLADTNEDNEDSDNLDAAVGETDAVEDAYESSHVESKNPSRLGHATAQTP